MVETVGFRRRPLVSRERRLPKMLLELTSSKADEVLYSRLVEVRVALQVGGHRVTRSRRLVRYLVGDLVRHAPAAVAARDLALVGRSVDGRSRAAREGGRRRRRRQAWRRLRRRGREAKDVAGSRGGGAVKGEAAHGAASRHVDESEIRKAIEGVRSDGREAGWQRDGVHPVPTKVPSPMDVKLDGSVMEVSELHSLKTWSPMDVRLEGSVMDAGKLLWGKAYSPIDVRLDGSITEVNESALWKAAAPIDVRPDGSVIEVSR